MMKKITSFSLLITFSFACFIFVAYAYDLPKWFPFNAQNSLQEWQEKVFKGKVFLMYGLRGVMVFCLLIATRPVPGYFIN